MHFTLILHQLTLSQPYTPQISRLSPRIHSYLTVKIPTIHMKSLLEEARVPVGAVPSPTMSISTACSQSDAQEFVTSKGRRTGGRLELATR